MVGDCFTGLASNFCRE
ncbi:hypothetical protein YPPY25_1968, partial [Yersinia pestis PY-25]